MNEHFDFLAPWYDRVIRFDRAERMRETLALPAPGILLDAGGGTGRVAEALRDQIDRIVIADMSTGMLAQADAKEFRSILAPAERLPFADSTFERVLMVDALHHVIDQADTIRDLYRVLKPGGRLVIEEPDLRTFAVKLIALAEKFALMRSHFLAPQHIANLFPKDANVKIEAQDGTAWIIVDKK
jgi:demethylmenaquinone methyltransferase/2-methoxy-6-polyprenyl-1,4-benzoquinol methylase